MYTQKSSKQKQEMITKLSSLLHSEWQSFHKQENDSSEPRIERTKDKEWIRIHGKDDVNITNTLFVELPKDWQSENRAAAGVAVNEVFKAIENGRNLDKVFIEEASAVVHDQWLKRNSERVPTEQKKLFEDLTEDEKEKDRAQIRKTIEIFQSYK